MKINFYATLRLIIGQKTIDLPLEPDSTVRELVFQVVDRYPAMRPELVNDDGEIHGHIHLFINGRDAPYLEDGLDSVIGVTDKIDIFPAVGGG